jgi:hypothetical protein
LKWTVFKSLLSDTHASQPGWSDVAGLTTWHGRSMCKVINSSNYNVFTIPGW